MCVCAPLRHLPIQLIKYFTSVKLSGDSLPQPQEVMTFRDSTANLQEKEGARQSYSAVASVNSSVWSTRQTDLEVSHTSGNMQLVCRKLDLEVPL